MANILEVLAECEGVANRSRLIAAGVTGSALRTAVENGDVIRARRGWFALPHVPPDIVAAIRTGGSLACVSGCVHHGLWRPVAPHLHVSVRRGARHLKHPHSGHAMPSSAQPPGLVLHWDRRNAANQTPPVLSLVDCIVQVFACQRYDIAFAILESALRQGKLGAPQVAAIEEQVTPKLRVLVREARSNADSGTESIFRIRMLRIGILMQSQVYIPGVGRADFVIGDRLLIEIDSDEHHGGAVNRKRDLERDATVARLGGVSLRFNYSQVLFDWETVEATVLAVIARGEHLAR